MFNYQLLLICTFIVEIAATPTKSPIPLLPKYIPGDETTYLPNYVVNTFAGNRNSKYKTDDTLVKTAQANGGIGFNYADSAFESDPNKQFQQYVNFAGGQNVSALKAHFTGIYGLATYNNTEDVYISDFCLIRKVDSSNIISVYGGIFYETHRKTYYDDILFQQSGQSCGWNDNTYRLNAQFNFPYGLAVDTASNLYVADTENLRIRRIDAVTGIVTTVAGIGDQGTLDIELGNSPDDLLNTYIDYPITVAVGGTNLYFVYKNQWIAQIDLTDNSYVGSYNYGSKSINDYGSLWSPANIDKQYVYAAIGNQIYQISVATNSVDLWIDTEDSSVEIASITGDWFENIYFFAIKTTQNPAQYLLNYCSIYLNKFTDSTTQLRLVGGGSRCKASVEGEAATSNSLLPGYYMAYDRTGSILWGQHFQDNYLDYPFYYPAVMKLTFTQPTSQPTQAPTGQPSSRPSSQPTAQPTRQPTGQPTSRPSGQPTSRPTTQPTDQPTSHPTSQPTRQPTSQPTSKPSRQPTSKPTGQPSGQPTFRPSRQPTSQPSGQPSSQPTAQPSTQPSSQPSGQPTSVPTGQPSGQPTAQPTHAPTNGAITLTHAQIAGLVVGSIMGAAFISAIVYASIVCFRAKQGFVPAESQV